MAWVPPEWLTARGQGPASDLDLAVVLLNSLDLLEEPADRLHDLAWWRDALRQLGHPRLAAAQRRADLPRLRDPHRFDASTKFRAPATRFLNFGSDRSGSRSVSVSTQSSPKPVRSARHNRR